MTRLALCPGSYDPITLGHVDVVRRARSIFDQVVVGVAHNSSKQSTFSLDQRIVLARQALSDVDGVRVEVVDGLVADFAREIGASAIVKGLRSSRDFDDELAMSLLNRHISGVETVFVMGDPSLAHVASSLVKDIVRYGGDVSGLVPEPVAHALQTALKGGRNG